MSQLPLAEPIRQVKIDSGSVSGLSHPEQKPQDIQLGSCSREARQHCHYSPAKQYPCNPDARSEFVQQQVAGYFKNEVAKKEDSREEPILLAGDSQLLVHDECREPNVDSVEDGIYQENENEGNDPRPHFAKCSLSNCGWSNCWTGCH